jgi:hypothetical protein
VRRTRPRPVSEKRLALLDDRRRCVDAVRRRSGGRCELRLPRICLVASCDVHEMVPRGRGGSPYDPSNCADACRPCHRFCHDFPAAARRLGFVLSGPSGGPV